MRNVTRLVRSLVFAGTLVGGLLAAGCGTKDCEDGTIFVELSRSGAAATADHLTATVNIAGGARRTATIAVTPRAGDDSLAIAFPDGYPKDANVDITLVAKVGDVAVASTSTSRKLSGGCDRIRLVLSDGTTTDDMGDGGDRVDGGDEDFAGCVPTVTACPVSQACGRVSNGCGAFIDCAVPCKVSAVTPRLGNTDHVVSFEGIFATGATVDFPGKTGVALTLAGSHHATAAVPAEATAGALVVRSGNVDLPAGSFRRATFALAPQSIDAYQTQMESGKQHPSLNTPRHQHTSLVVGGSLYLFGGNTSGNGIAASNGIESMRINADGSLGAPVSSANGLATSRIGAAAVIIGKRVYVIGGRDNTASLTSIEYATIGADGSLSTFTQVANALLTGRAFATVAVVGDSLYVVGGNLGALDVGTVERAVIGADDSLGAFTTVAGVTVKTGRSRHAMFVTSSSVIVAGGISNGTETASVEVAPIDGSGVLGDFVASGTLPGAVSGEPYTQWGGMLYVHPYTATVSATGVASAFGDVALPTYGINSVGGMAATVVRDSVFLSGGSFDGSPRSTVARIGLSKGAALGAFTTSSTNSLPEGRSGAVGVVSGDTLYVIGGQGPVAGASAVIYQATINPDDTLGPFSQSTSTLATPVSKGGAAMLRNRVFVVGGAPGLTSVQVATIGADGKLGSFASAGQALAIGRQGFGISAIANAICVVGGYTGAGYTDTYECATVDAAGALGAFAQVTDANAVSLKVKLATTRGFHTSAVVKGNLAVFGGSNNSPRTSVEQIGLQTGWPSMAFNPTVVAGVTVSHTEHTGLAIGDWLYLFGDTSLTTTVLRTDTVSFNTPFAADATAALNASLYAPVAYLIGNRTYVIGGIGNGGQLAAIQSAPLK